MREFRLAPFGGLSAATIQAHLDLYKGYCEQSAAVRKQLQQGQSSPAALTARETLARRLSFESNGAVLHELFFEQFEGAGNGENPAFTAALLQRFGSFQNWQED